MGGGGVKKGEFNTFLENVENGEICTEIKRIFLIFSMGVSLIGSTCDNIRMYLLTLARGGEV